MICRHKFDSIIVLLCYGMNKTKFEKLLLDSILCSMYSKRATRLVCEL